MKDFLTTTNGGAAYLDFMVCCDDCSSLAVHLEFAQNVITTIRVFVKALSGFRLPRCFIAGILVSDPLTVCLLSLPPCL